MTLNNPQGINSPLDNPIIHGLRKRAEELKGPVPSEENPAGILDLDQLEEDFSSDDYYTSEYDGKYDYYSKKYDEFVEAGDAEGAHALTAQFNKYKAHRNYYQDSYDCTFNGECEEGKGTNFFEDQSEEWRYDDLVNNEPLLKSIRETYGSYDYKGDFRSDEELIKEFMKDQAYLEYAFASKAVNLASLPLLTDKQLDNLALQYLTYQKIKSGGEGARPTLTQTRDVVGAMGLDVVTSGGISSLIKGVVKGTAKLTGKDVEKEAVKPILKDFLEKRIKSKTLKNTLVGTGIGSGWMGFDAITREAIVISADLQDEVNWEKVAIQTGLGGVFGGSFGALVGGASKAYNHYADRYMIREGLTNQQMMDEMASSVKDPKSLFKWLKKIGWTRKEAKEELRFLKEEGFKFNKEKNLWITKDGKAEYQTPMTEKLSEKAHFGSQVEKRIVPKPVQRKGEEVLDKEYTNVQNIDLPIPFSQRGQQFFDTINSLGTTIGPKIARTIYGTDSLLIRLGLRPEAMAINDAMIATDLNVSRMSHSLRSLVSKNEVAIGDVNKLIRNRTPKNKAQAEFLKELDALKDNQMRMAFKNKLITHEDYQKFLADKSYIPRVWNIQHLITNKGAQEFSTFLQKLWNKDPKATKAILKNITREKDVSKMTDDIINSRFAPGRIKNVFQHKADRELDVHRSSHLEHQRKLEVAEEYEHMLDQFMAKPLDRWAKFFEDVVKRNEFARRFGANDEKILKRIKELEKQKKGLAADHLKEAYFTTLGKPETAKEIGSQTIANKMNNPRWMQGVAKINAFQNLKLGLAAIPNATQAFVNGTTKLTKSQGLVKAPFLAMSALVRSVVKTRRDMDIVHRTGVLGETDLSRIATENMPHARIIENEFKGPLKYLNESTKFLRAVGFLGVEEMNRRAAAIMAHGHVASLHSKLAKLNAKGKGRSKKALGIEKEMKRLGVMEPHKAELSARDYAVSGHIFNKQVNFSGESFNLPNTWQGPYGKLLTKFKSFMFYQARFLKREVSDELFLNHNAKPLVTYLAAAGVAGNVAEMVRSLATGKDIEENRNALELLISGIGNAGGAGLWWDTMKQVSERGPAGAWGILGPTASDAVYTIQDLSNADINNIIKRMLPNIPGKHQLMDSIKY